LCWLSRWHKILFHGLLDVTMTDLRILDELHDGPATRMLRRVEPFAQVSPAPEESLPDYVEHRDGVTEIGKLSAEAIVGEYEAAAEAIESLAIELVEQVRLGEAMCRQSLSVIGELKEVAGRHREEAKRIFLHIESCSQIAAEVRRVCAELKGKLPVPALADEPQKVSKPKRKVRGRRKSPVAMTTLIDTSSESMSILD
jgi:hypothetical protein